MSLTPAKLYGGPVDQRVVPDVTESTETIKIPSNSNTKFALYQRAGNEITPQGRQLRFDFVNVYDADGRPMTDW
jgi:hypothetical protein